MNKIFKAIIGFILIYILVTVYKNLFIDHKLFTNIEVPRPTFSHTGGIKFE